MITILKKAKKLNFGVLKQVSAMAQQIALQMQSRQIDPEMVKGYLESPESPINVNENFEKNYRNVCEELNIDCK